mgnify:CR=1 FL=1
MCFVASSPELKFGVSSHKKDIYDLHHFLDHTKSPIEAFRAHAECMRGVGDHLDKVAKILEDFGQPDKVTVDADVHFITVHGPKDFHFYV